MTSAQREVWAEMRERFVLAMTARVNKSQVDMEIVYNLHFAIFGKPKYKPNTDCNIDYRAWNLIIENLDNEFNIF